MVRTENYLREFASMLFAQKHVVFWTTILVLAGSILVVAFWPPTYSATGSILVSGKQVDVNAPEALEKKPGARPFAVTKEDLASEVEILSSAEVIKAALRALSPGAPEPPLERVIEVRESLRAITVPASNVITVRYYSRDAHEAVRVLDAVLASYLSYRLQFYKPAPAQLTPPFLETQAERQHQALNAKMGELVELLDRTGVSSPDKEIENNIILKKRIEEELNVLTGQQIELQATIEHLQQALDRRDLQYFAFLESPTIGKLGEKLTELTAERGRLLRAYRPESEVVSVVEEQIQATFASLKAEVQLIMAGYRLRLRAGAEKVARMQATLADYDQRNLEMEKQIIETERIAREADLLKRNYETLARRKGEVEIDELLAPKDTAMLAVSIMSRAFPSNGPVFPRPLVIPLGFLVGLLTGLSFAFVREYFDHTFKRPNDIATHLGLPVLFSLAAPRERGVGPSFYLAALFVVAAGIGVYVIKSAKLLPLF
jgi:uncharacterized protein involved in exopolysaccharide biosynthesis